MDSVLGKLKTDLGERSTYDAASQCSRCGYCEQACPTYVASGRETYSPRGRNQLVRMILEGKLKDPSSAADALSTCLLCGACSSACYAHVPTAELVLEGRRAIRKQTPLPVRLASWLIAEHPKTFARILRLAHLMKRLGIAELAARTRLLRLVGLGGLELAALEVREAPLRFLSEILRRDSSLTADGEVRWLYFSACGTNYLFPRVGLAATSVLKKLHGPGALLDAGCCGLLMYNYGELEAARKLARRVIEAYEREASRRGGPVVVADCSSCAAHLKNFPQMFLGDSEWLARAEKFSARVRDFIQMAPSDASLPPKQEHQKERTAYHDSCRARHGQGLVDEPRRLALLVGEQTCALAEPGECCGGAGAFAFTQPELSDDILKRKIASIAATQASVVMTSSTSCLLQLAHGLKKYYPEARVTHIAEQLARRLSLHAEGKDAGGVF